MAVITSAASGNFADGSTWVGGVAPISTDTFVVATGHEVTIAEDVTSAGGTVESLQGGGLVLNANLTMTGVLSIGNGAAKDGCLTLGAGTTLTTNSVLYFNNMRLRTTATSSNWAKIVITAGAGIKYDTSVYTMPRQDIDVAYISIIGEAAGIKFYASGRSDRGGSALTHQIKMPHCVFDGVSEIYIGFGGHGHDATCARQLDYSEFRGAIKLQLSCGTSYTAGTQRSALRCVVAGAGAVLTNLRVQDTVNSGSYWDFRGSIFYDANLQFEAIHGHDFRNSLWYGSSALAAGATQIATKGSKFNGSYVFREEGSLNAHPLSLQPTTAAIEDALSGAVFEVYGTEPNQIAGSATAAYDVNVNGVLDIGHGDTFNIVGDTLSPNVIVERCTRYIRDEGNVASIFLTETLTYSGQAYLRSNLVYGAGYGRGIRTAVSSGVQDIYQHDYNVHYGVASITNDDTKFNFIGGRGANDVSADPQFVDPTRRLRTYAQAKGLSATDAAAVAYFLACNGYNTTTKTQSDTPTNADVSDLVSWVRAGYAPTNAALAGAGYLGVDIGALDVGSADDTAPNLTIPTATATGPTTATASISTDDGNGTLYFLASTNATESASTVKAALSQSVTAAGAQSISLSALNPGTTYYVHFVQINGAGLESASVVSTAAFTTDAVVVKGATITLYAGTTPQASLTNIVALWWDATTPSGAPDYSTTTASTDESGVLTLDLDAATALSIGDSGFLLLYKLDAADHRDSLVFAGRVAVSDVA